jgi:TonB family protein
VRHWLAHAATLALAAAAGCGKPAPAPEQAGAQPVAPLDQEPPVPLNPESPIQYPPRLYDQQVEGDVVLRLFADSTGRLAAESSKVAESSGYSALDSAALAGAKKLKFAPARQHGHAVATVFLQPIEFRHASAGGAPGAGAAGSTPLRGPADSSAAGRPGPPAPAAAPSRPRVRRARLRPPPDTNGARQEIPAAPPDTSGARRDTSSTRRDTTRTKADSGAVPH